MNTQQPGKRSASELWEHAKDFVNKSDTMAVRVTACRLAPKFEGAIPLVHYTWELVRLHEGRVFRHFPIMASVEAGIVKLEDFPWDEFIELQKEAMAWVHAQRQERENLLRERQLSKERNAGARGLRTIVREDIRKRSIKV